MGFLLDPHGSNPSPFEAAIIAEGPIFHARFRDADFSSIIADSSGNGRDLVRQIAAATRSAVPTRTTHPGGAYFPSVTYDNWATLGTFYKRAAESLLSAASEYTLLVSFRIIKAPSTHTAKMFAIGTENVGAAGTNDLVYMRGATGAPTNPHHFNHRINAAGNIPVAFDVTEVLEDGVNRLAIVRYHDANSVYRLSTSKPGHEALLESTAALSGTALEALNRALIVNARSETVTGSSTTLGTVMDQLAIFPSDIGAAAEADLHSKWMAEVAGAGYYPSMMLFDGSTGYYSLTADIDVSAGWTVTGRFRWDGGTITSAGGFNRIIFLASGIKAQIGVINDESGDSRAGRLSAFCQNGVGTTLLNICGTTVVSDGEEHTFFVAYDPSAGTAVMRVDEGADEINTGATGHTITTGTIATGSAPITVGARANPDRFWDGLIGPLGIRGAYLTNYTDFMDGNLPKAIDEKNWTEFGAQPLFWSHTGQMDNNKGSAGDMTLNGSVVMTTGGSP